MGQEIKDQDRIVIWHVLKSTANQEVIHVLEKSSLLNLMVP
jgi:hypothetical protein